MTAGESGSASLWNDNPSEVDLLGFDAVVAPIVDAIGSDHLDPLTIGVHAKWGGGKSTILGLLLQALASDDSVVVVQTNPWEYDDHEDVKGTLIAEVLDQLQVTFKDDGTLTNKCKDLLSRISWSRVGKVVAKSVILQTPDLAGLAKSLTPEGRESPKSMAGFKNSFAELIELLPDKRRVVVLVDDLDRCMPPAVTATLEAIKLFLSVEGMVFVVAADQDMVRDAIAMNLGSSPESSRYAQRYLDKIVQLPVSLPVLPSHEAEAYIGLLLSKSTMGDEHFKALVLHVQQRRLAGQAHLLSELGGLDDAPSDDVIRLASQLARGLRSDKVVNPREIKRFLNAYHVRRRIAEVRDVTIRPDVLAKLLLLEDRFNSDFEVLLNVPEAERKAHLEAWSAWAQGETGATKPDGVSDTSKEWAATEPDLSSEAIGPYLTLAASFANKRHDGAAIDADLAALINDLAGDAETLRREAVGLLTKRSEEDQRIAMDGLFTHARQTDEANNAILSLIEIAVASNGLAQDIGKGIKESCWNQIDAGTAVELASADNDVMKSLAQKLADDDSVDGQVAQAARGILEGAS